MEHFFDITPLIEWLRNNQGYAGLIAFIISGMESVPIIGTIVPGTVTMTALGGLVGAGIIPFWTTMFWAIVGAILGDNSGYWLGKYYKDRIRSFWFFQRHPEWFTNTEKFFLKHGGKSVFIGRFLGPVRSLIPVVAGMMNLSTTRFMIANVTSAILWAPAYMFLGLIAGAASSALPPAVAIQLFIYLLGALFVLWLIAKILKIGLRKIVAAFQHGLAILRFKLQQQPRLHSVHQFFSNPNASYGDDLILLMLLALVMFGILIWQLLGDPAAGVDREIDLMTWNLFSSFRTATLDQIMAIIPILTDVKVFVVIWVVIGGTLLMQSCSRTVWYWFLLLAVTIFISELVRLFIHSSYPLGLAIPIMGSSFPNLHTAITTAIVGFWSVLVAFEIDPALRRIPYWCAVILISLIFIADLYFGRNWLSDMVGGLLIGVISVACITFFYLRKTIPHLKLASFIVPTFLIWCFAGAIYFYNYYEEALLSYKVEWSTQTIEEDNWWQQEQRPLILYRSNRLGKIVEIINVQSLVKINDLTEHLKKQGWVLQSPRDILDTLKLLVGAQQEYSVLFKELYHDRPPVLVISKTLRNNTLLILKLWDSDINLQYSRERLWIGTLDYYTLQKNKYLPLNSYKTVNPEAKKLISTTNEFTKYLEPYEWKQIDLPEFAIDSIPKASNEHRLLLLIR